MWDVKRPHFLLGFDPSLCYERLIIPPNFVKHVEGSAPGVAVLVGPSGNSWFANVVLVDGCLFFSDGWEAFVRDHLLEQGDSLVFRYDGDLQFNVQIFDHSMCEKEAAVTAQSSQDSCKYENHIVKKRDRERTVLLDSIIGGIPKRMRCYQGHSGSISKNHGNSMHAFTEEECTQEGDCNGKSSDAITIAVPITAIPHDNIESSVSRTSKLDMLLSASEAERMAQSFTSSFPSFLKVMKRFNISGSYTLNVPYQFATEHLPKCKVKIVLRNLKGESWTVNSIPTTKVQTSHTFCGGWLSFVRDNNIDFGDICIFELIRKYELRVRVLRVGKEGLDGHHGDAINGSGKGRFITTPNRTRIRKSKKMKGTHPNVKGSAVSTQSDNLIVESGSHTKGCMSMKSAPEEKLAAQYFVSSFPHFVRSMKKFNVSGSFTLKIPYQFSMEHLPSCRTEIVLRNLGGKCWTVNSVPTTKVQTLHTFCGGWMAFVRDNDIQMGDICIFELVGKCEMRVHICGIGKKGLSYHNTVKSLPMS